MGRSAIIFHGTGGNPDAVWYRWLGDRLEARGISVEIPHDPGLDVEPVETFLATVLVGHSDVPAARPSHRGGP